MWTVRTDDYSNRKCTNISWLYFCIGLVTLMFVTVIYSASKADLNRLVKGYDDCGNICGQLNEGITFTQCGSNDKTKDPKLEVNIIEGNELLTHFKCVKKCKDGYKEIFNRCWKTDEKTNTAIEEIQGIPHDLMLTWPSIAIVCGIAFVFSYILLILFRYAIKYVIWIIYIGFIMLIAAGAVGCWMEFSKTNDPEEAKGYLKFALTFSVLTVFSIIILICLRKRVRLVAQLFEEASKALIDIPTILFEPILTFFALLLSFAPFMYFAIMIETSGTLIAGESSDGKFKAQYDQDFGIYAARFLNIVGFIWFTQFIFGCQHFVIAGTISKWYYGRDKTKLDSPIMTSFKHLICFHLGSVCLGSMIITIVKIIRMIANTLKENSQNESPIVRFLACCFSWLAEQLEELLKYLVRNAYIIVAKDGTPFFESGKRAFDLLFKNLMDVVTLNNFGDIALFMGRLFVVGIAGFIGYAMMDRPDVTTIFYPMAIALFFAFLIAHCFVSVFEMTVDTILICFCEDSEENDGASKPYYMSDNLRRVMNELKESTSGQFNFVPMAESREPLA